MPRTRKKKKKVTPKLKKYHFDLGDSNEGPVGFCASVYAYSKTEALRLLCQALPEAEDVRLAPDHESDGRRPGVDYISFYTNDAYIRTEDINFEEKINGN